MRKLCDGYLKKPVSKADLVLALMTFLKHTVTATPSEERKQPHAKAAKAPTADSLKEELSEAATLAKLPELLELLEGKLAQWETLRQAMAIDDIVTFAVQIQAVGTDYQTPFLVAWAERLQSQASLFEMELLPETLSQFPEMIRTIQSHIHT